MISIYLILHPSLKPSEALLDLSGLVISFTWEEVEREGEREGERERLGEAIRDF